MLPFRYAVRNLFRDPSRMIQAVGGAALVTLLVMGATAFNQGMTRILTASGNPHNVILLGAGSENSLQRSEIPERAAGIAGATIPGIVTRGSRRAVSPELHFMGYISLADREPVQTLIRGVTPPSLWVHTEVTLQDGHFPGPGEILAGRLAWKTLGVEKDDVQVGTELTFDHQRFIVSGLFAAPGTVMESELWMDLNDLRTITQRDNLSGILIRLDTPDTADAALFTTRRRDLELAAVPESEYYAQLAQFYGPIRTMTWITAGLIGVGALVGGFNTLYAAFASRIAELATLQTLGYSRPAILFSLVQEALMASLLGALLACVVALALFDGLVVSFSLGIFTLRITPSVVLAGLGTGIALGLLGAIPPALRCLLPPLPVALRSAA